MLRSLDAWDKHDIKSMVSLHLCPDQSHPDCPDHNSWSRWLKYQPPPANIVAKVSCMYASFRFSQGSLSVEVAYTSCR